jgi:hypothetical protein
MFKLIMVKITQSFTNAFQNLISPPNLHKYVHECIYNFEGKI